ncbi:AIR synthase related protein [Parageobacillus toebii]|uniref:AIR synthase related protein n=1 Tax=Parageobacillus toebii TaxID=153151 RepID=UPI002815F33E|nr:AIR synthase related protein [Parageobacillus toebii]WMT18989.1 AIR synthase related protein [Parageobacillus toebii]
MRDVLFIPFYGGTELVVAADGSAAIGEKEKDVVHAPYDVVSYFAARVAFMEVLSVGAKPHAVVLQNFVHDEAWETLCNGIRRTCQELHIDIPVIGSSETNFPTLQSAVGIVVVGMVQTERKRVGITPKDAKFAVIGEPLVGDEVLKRKERMLSLSLFQALLRQTYVYEIVPVGSKGIYYELQQLLQDNGLSSFSCSCSLPLFASSGPATSVLISYDPHMEEEIKKMVKDLFFSIELRL